MSLRLGDFGISKVFSKTKDQAKSFVGTPYYISPEILQGKVKDFNYIALSIQVRSVVFGRYHI